MSSSDEFESAGEENEKDLKTTTKTMNISMKNNEKPIGELESKLKVDNKDTNNTSNQQDLENDWDNADWGDDISSINVEPSQKKENDNWSDFVDDWENEETVVNYEVTKEKKITENNNSSDKSSNDEDKDVSCVSSYDAFPVLNELSTIKKVSQSVKSKPSDKIEITQVTTAHSSWSSWKPWGGVVSSFISTASQGLSTVIENSIGVPDPEQLARMNIEEGKQKAPENDPSCEVENTLNNKCEISKEEKSSKSLSPTEDTFIPKFGNLVTGVTSIGSKVLSGGLDTLEGIGKKTMTILQENDPLLLNKRKMLGLETEKPVLSQILREAKEKSEEVEKNLKQMHKQSYKKQLHFESLFDNYYGLVHLEALEMLSKQSAIKLQSLMDPLSGKALIEMQETLNEVKEICDLGDFDYDADDGLCSSCDLEEKLQTAIEDLGIETDFKDIINCVDKTFEYLDNIGLVDSQSLYEKALHCVAETCALSISKMHKIAEILLIKEHHSTANEADSLVQLTHVFCSQIHFLANRFCEKLNTCEANEEIKSLITSIFLEVYNSTTYIQNAFQLFIPILQIGAA